MKKKNLIMSIIICLILVGVIGTTHASTLLEDKIVQINKSIKILCDSKENKLYDATGTEVFPITYNGTTYVPLRAISTLLGADVNWNQEDYSVELKKEVIPEVSVETKIKDNNPYKNNSSIIEVCNNTSSITCPRNIWGNTDVNMKNSRVKHDTNKNIDTYKNIYGKYELEVQMDLVYENGKYYFVGYVKDLPEEPNEDGEYFGEFAADKDHDVNVQLTANVQCFTGGYQNSGASWTFDIKIMNLHMNEKRMFKYEATNLAGRNDIDYWLFWDIDMNQVTIK